MVLFTVRQLDAAAAPPVWQLDATANAPGAATG